jgi:hypothetical protein
LPWLHIADVVAEQALERGFRCVGLTGTRWLVESEVYPEKLKARGIAYVRPDSAERKEINRIIMDELVNGVFMPEAIVYFQSGIRLRLVHSKKRPQHYGRKMICDHGITCPLPTNCASFCLPICLFARNVLLERRGIST